MFLKVWVCACIHACMYICLYVITYIYTVNMEGVYSHGVPFLYNFLDLFILSAFSVSSLISFIIHSIMISL